MVLPPRNGLSLCAGAGGLDMGLMLAEPEFHTRCFVEWEEYPRRALIAAQKAGYFAPAPIWDDVTTFDAKPLAGAIDTLLAGYPCQPFSQAGQRKGEDDERHLWTDIVRILKELGPDLEWCFFENVAGHLTLGLETVLRSLRNLGFSCAAGLFSAEEVGATHERQRVFIVAYRPKADGERSSRKPTGRRRPANQSGEVDDARLGWGRESDAKRHNDHRHDSGRQKSNGWPRKQSQDVGNTAGIGRGKGRSEHEIWGGRNTPARDGSELADKYGEGPQGQQRDQRDAQGRKVASRSARLRGRTGLFPPGPNEMSAWRSCIAVAPDLAPATSFGDIAREASHFAAMVASRQLEETQAERALRRMVDGLASRSRALRLLGNGVVPLEAAHAWRTLSAAHGLRRLDLGATPENREADPTEPDLNESTQPT